MYNSILLHVRGYHSSDEETTIVYQGSKEDFVKWQFCILLKRKFLFYSANLLIPLASHAFLAVLVFHIPAKSTEKMTLSINLILSLIVFRFMLAEIIPITSLVVPLLSR